MRIIIRFLDRSGVSDFIKREVFFVTIVYAYYPSHE